MAVPDSGSEQAGQAFAYFLASGMPALLIALAKLQGVAIEGTLVEFRDAIGAIIEGLLRDVNATAVEMAAVADAKIIEHLYATQASNRPHTGQMDAHILSEPGSLGIVKVGLIDELEKIVNQRGQYGTFWRAQEYGTGDESGGKVPSQEGRPLFGTFDPSGSPPDSAQRGRGAGQDLAFVPFGSAPGFGRISVELPGRHFLRDGATEAGATYIARMDAIRDKYMERFRALMKSLQAERAARTITMRIEA
jgi:hypothetical protein